MNDGGDIPSGYIVQIRENGTMMWRDVLNVEHDVLVALYSVAIENLEPATVYYIRIIPFIDDGGVLYLGSPTEEGGPFLTLHIGGLSYSIFMYKSPSVCLIVC